MSTFIYTVVGFKCEQISEAWGAEGENKRNDHGRISTDPFFFIKILGVIIE